MPYVYVMYSPTRGLYKIGKADDIESRHRTFKTVEPDIEVTLRFESDSPFTLEASLHDKFRHKRVWADHEWFRLEPGDLRWLKQNGAQVYRRIHWAIWFWRAVWLIDAIIILAALGLAVQFATHSRILEVLR